MHCVSSYRPHDPGHNYYEPGIYLITLVTRARTPLFGRLNDDIKAPAVVLTEVGKAVMEEWDRTHDIQMARGNDICVLNQVCMPDHWHGVVQVNNTMNKSLGRIIQYVKSVCTARWREITGTVLLSSSTEAIRGVGFRKRQSLYEDMAYNEQPLFDDNYDDTICIDEEHRLRMLRYVDDNPRRAIIRRLRPDFMQRRQHVVIGGRDYAAFGNLFLLRWPRKVQVFCHRKAPDGRTPYEQTEAYRQQCREWKRQVMEGATVIVTPGISKGEFLIKNRCLESHYPLIHLQKEPIGEYWKPEESRFNACSQGSLLILAPWHADQMGDVKGVPQTTDYSIFHNLNTLAQEICCFDGDATIVSR